MASIQGPSPFLPARIHSTRPVSQSAAYDFVSAYLDRAAKETALQPNASITDRGAVSKTTVGAPNLTLYSLRRVQAGLGGKVLGWLRTQEERTGLEGNDTATMNGGAAVGWEDARKWEQEQQEQEVPVGEEDPNENARLVEDETVVATTRGTDKEERKRKKKERRLAERRRQQNGSIH